RELAQCIRRVILKRNYEGQKSKSKTPQDQLKAGIDSGTLTADELLGGYCKMLYDRCGTYEEVAKLTAMDRRTVKKRVQEHGQYDDGSKSK
ncbi:MAG: sigma-54-dependent Fis family transcriptional regulator, partial [Planctomycetota bacterium]